MEAKRVKRRNILFGAYALSHFLVDFSCAFLMLGSVFGTRQWYLCALIYNFCAFAMQMPLGILADKLNSNARFAAAGCAAVATSFLFAGVPIAASLLAGIGNGMFHVGGGVDVLNESTKKAAALGVFVSPGAFGIYFGSMLGKSGADPGVLVPIALLAAAAAIVPLGFLCCGSPRSLNAPISFDIKPPSIFAAIACLFLVVCLRSYVGIAAKFDWSGTGVWGVAAVCAVVLGKTAGGFLSDRLGAARACAVSLTLAGLAFLAAPTSAIAGIAALFLFNMTMPVTLWAVARLMPGAKGFSFGLLTFGLFLGFLPSYFNASAPLGGVALLALCLVSLAMLSAGIRGVGKAS